MKTFTYTIADENGIHARPAGVIVKAAKAHPAAITLSMETENGETRQADGKKLFAVMGLGAKKGTVLTVTAEGEEEDAAAQVLYREMQNAGL